MKEKIIDIVPTSPFNFELTKQVVKLFSPTSENYKIINKCIVFSYNFKNQLIIISLKDAGTLEKPHLQVKLFYDYELDESEITYIQKKIIRHFSLDIDLKKFYTFLYYYSCINKEMRSLYGYHPVSFSSITEAGIWAILTQHSSIEQSIMEKGCLIKLCSFTKKIKYLEFSGFPTISQLSKLSQSQLFEVIQNQKKVNYISNFIKALKNIDEEYLFNFSYDEIFNFLIDIKGIGRWSAEFIILRGAANFSKVPLSEKANIGIFQKYYLDSPIEAYLSFYGDSCGLWIHYLRIFNYLKTKREEL